MSVLACSTDVRPVNPYDPDAPVATQVKGTIAGTVVAEALYDPADLEVLVDGTTPGGEVIGSDSLDVRLEPDGPATRFSVALPAGTFAVRVTLPGFETIELFGITVTPGRTTDVGTVKLRAGRGALTGRIMARAADGTQSAAPLDTRVTLIRLAGQWSATTSGADCADPGAEEVSVAAIRSDGTFAALGLAAGPYLVAAERDGFVPTFIDSSVEVQIDDTTDAGDLIMLETSSMVRIVPPADAMAANATVTRSTSVTVELVLPPLYNAVQISEDPTFGDSLLGDVDFGPVSGTTVAWTLPAGDGTRELFVRYRAPTCTVSPIFSGTIVLDTTPPTVDGLGLVSGEGCTNDSLVALAVEATDPCETDACAGLYRMRLAHDGALDGESWVPYDGQAVLDLGTDGDYTILVEISDAAGNVSASDSTSVAVQSSAPTPNTQAVIVDGGATTVFSLNVSLTFDIDGVEQIEIGHASGLDGSGWQPMPVTRTLPWRLQDGDDGTREVHVRFADDCGNVTQEYFTTVLVDRSARMQGSARLEGRADHSGSTVSSWLWDAGAGDYSITGPVATTGSDGSFTLTGLEPGQYRLVFSHDGFASRNVDGLIVVAGALVQLPELQLSLARGGIDGIVTLEGQTDHSGIQIDAGPGVLSFTDGNGAFQIDNLVIGDYTLTARYPGHATTTSASPVIVVEGQTTTATAMELSALPGRLSGTAQRSDSADHTGIDVLLSGTSVGGTAVNLSTTTDATGAYSFDSAPAGTYSVTISSAGYRNRVIGGVVVEPAGKLSLGSVSLDPATGSLDGIVTLAGEDSHGGIRVEVAPDIFTYTDSTGAYIFTGLKVGDYLVSAEKDQAFQPANAGSVTTVLENQTVTAPAIELQPVPGSIAGTVERWGAADHSAINVQASGLTIGNTEQTASAVTNTQGMFTITGLTAGIYTLTMSTPSYRSAQVQGLVISPAEQLVLPSTVVLEPATGDVAGTVTLQGETVHADIRAGLWQNNVERYYDFSNSSGAYSLTDVAAGEYTLKLSRGGFSTRSIFPVIVTADQVTPIGAEVLVPQVGQVRISALDVTTDPDNPTVDIRGEYPAIADARICEDPAVTDPTTFTTGDCDWQSVTFNDGGPEFDAITIPFTATQCPNPGDATAVCDGAKTIWVRLRDSGSAVSDWFELPLVLDRRPPTGHIVINPSPDSVVGSVVADQGAYYSNSESVSVTLVAADDRSGVATGDVVSGVVSARIYVSPADPNPTLVTMAEGTKTLQSVALLASPTDGARQLYLELRDAAGNSSAPDLASVVCPDPRTIAIPTDCDSIFLDRAGPTGFAFSINPINTDGDYTQGKMYTPSPFVQLGIDSELTGLEEDEGIEAVIANDSGFVGSQAQPMVAARVLLSWALTPGDELKRVYIKLRDRAGNLSNFAMDEITLDTQAPASPVLTAVGEYTQNRTPTLAFTAVGDADGYDVELYASDGTPVALTAVTATSYQPVAALPDDRYSWRARSWDAAGHVSPFAQVDIFTVDDTDPGATAFALLTTPTADKTPTLSWNTASGASHYELQLASLDTFPVSTTSSYFPTQSQLTLPALTDGPWHARVRGVDEAGNVGPWATTLSFEIDTNAPLNPNLTGPAADAVLGSATVQISWGSVSDAAGYVLHVGTDPNLATFEEYRLATTTRTVELAHGAWTFRVGCWDAAGNESDILSAVKRSFTVDTVPANVPTTDPVGQVINIRNPTFTWSDESASGATSYILKLDGADTPDITATSYDASGLTDSEHSFAVASVDDAGNVSAFSPLRTFAVDATAPGETTLIAVSPDPTRATTARLSWTAVTGADRYTVQWDSTSAFNSVGDFGAQVVTTTSYDAGPLTEKTWYWRVRAEDDAGNTSAFTSASSFVVDTTPPTGTVTIVTSNGTEPTKDTNVRLDLTQAGNAIEVAYGNGSLDCSSASYVAYPTATNRRDDWPVPAGTGTKLVSVCFRDAAGNTSIASDTVEVDQTPPTGTVTILGGDPTNQRYVDLRLDASPDVARYRAETTDPIDCDTGTYTGFVSIVPSHDLGTTPGTLTVSVCFEDVAGNRASATAEVTLDLASPSGTIAILGPDPTNVTGATVRITSADADEYAVQNGSISCDAVSYTPLTASPTDLSWALPGGDGTKTVAACLRDVAGNTALATEAVAGDASVTLDQTPPSSLVLTIGSGAPYTNLNPIDLAVAAFDLNGVSDLMLAADVGFTVGDAGVPPDWETFPGGGTRTGWDFVGGNGPKMIHMRVRDDAGNVAEISRSVELDQSEPDPATVVLADGQSIVNQRTIPVTISGTVADTMKFWEDTGGGCGDPACAGPSFIPFAAVTTVTLSENTGGPELKTVCWKLCDLAGNDTAVDSATITLGTYIDRPTPVLTSISPQTYVALSHDYPPTYPDNNYPSARYPLYIAGDCIAYDTRAQIGDFELPCIGADPEQDCQVGACSTTCDATCVVSLPDAIMRNADTYVVRLHTPDPVDAGVGTSTDTAFFSAVAPVPRITKIYPRGIIQKVDAFGQPIPQDVAIQVWGSNFMDDVQCSLGYTTAAVISLQEQPANTAGRFLELRVNTAGMHPSADQTLPFSCSNRAPGGGTVVVPFGINPEVIDCLGTCRSQLGWTRADREGPYDTVVRGDVRFQDYGIDGAWFGGAAWHGGTAAQVRDSSGNLLTRVTRHASGGSIPLPLGAASVRLEDARGDGVLVSLSRSEGRGAGTVTTTNGPAFGAGVDHIAVGDLNGDGYLDAVASDWLNDTVTTLLGDQTGTLAITYTAPTRFNAWAVALGDLDGDGVLDLVGTNFDVAPAVAVWKGLGDGGMGQRTDIPVPQATDVEIADVNGDQAADIVVHIYRTTNDIEILFNDGRGGFFQSATACADCNNTGNFRVADVNNDGALDLVMTEPTDVGVALGDGTGQFGSVILSDVTAANSLDLGDFNRDGWLDVAIGDFENDLVRIALGNGDGSFQTPNSYSHSEAGKPLWVAAGDLNGDGDTDLATNFSLFTGNGDGTLAASAFLDVGGWDGVLADINGDGVVDVAMASGTTVDVGLGDRGATLGSAINFPFESDGTPSSTALGDFDVDGEPDLVVADGFVDGFEIYLGEGGGSFGGTPSTVLASTNTKAITTDLNGDGWQDVIGILTGHTYAGVALGNGNGTFGPMSGVSIKSGAQVMDFATGDLDRDGNVDFVGAAYGTGEVIVALGQGDGNFDTPVEIFVESEPTDVALADLDGDGALDIVTSHANQSAGIAVTPGRGDGSFDPSYVVDTQDSDGSIAAGDIDGDGDVDLVSSRSTGVYLWYNDGDGFFGTPSQYSTAVLGPIDLVDFNGSGALDIIGAGGPNEFSICLAGGPPCEEATLFLTVTGWPAIGDLNRDGAPDIVTANSSTDDITVSMMVAPGSWEQELRVQDVAAAIIPVGTSTHSVGQALQYVEDLSIRIVIDDPAVDLNRLTLALRTPSYPSEPELLLDDTACGADWTGASVLEASYPTTAVCAGTDLADAHGWQPMGDWTLVITNPGADAYLVDFAIVARAQFNTELPGTSRWLPEQLVLAPGQDTKTVAGTTLNFPDWEKLPCAESNGDLDFDGVGDVGEHWYEIDLSEPSWVDVEVLANFDASLAHGDGTCDAAFLNECDDNSLAAGKKSPALTDLYLAAGTHCFVVDGANFDGGEVHHGDYQFRISARTFSEDFSTNTLEGSRWDVGSGDFGTSSTAFFSDAYSLRLGGTGATVPTLSMDTTDCATVEWRYEGKRGPVPPSPSTSLTLEYYDGSGWVSADVWMGDGFEDLSFMRFEGTLSGVGTAHASFALRFVSAGDAGDFFVDDVVVTCVP